MTRLDDQSSFVSAVTLLGGEGVLHAQPRAVMDWIPWAALSTGCLPDADCVADHHRPLCSDGLQRC